jgi:hypothetical protein
VLPSSTIRGWYLEQLRKGLQTTDSILKNVSQHDATTYRDGGTGWTVLEVICHLRDFESVYHERSVLTCSRSPLPEPG